MWFTGCGPKSGRNTHQTPDHIGPTAQLCRQAEPMAVASDQAFPVMQDLSPVTPPPLRDLEVHLGSLFPTGEATDSRGNLSGALRQPGGGHCGQSVVLPLTLPKWSSSLSVTQGAALASPLHSGNFMRVACLWIVTRWSSCEGNRSQENLYPHLNVITPSFNLDKWMLCLLSSYLVI